MAPMTDRHSVLIVDDNTLFAEAIARALRMNGIRVSGLAGSGAAALAAAVKRPPRLILVDIGLPDMSGLALGQRLLKTLPDARILALTAVTDARVAEEAFRIGFAGYLTKDMSVREFVDAVRSGLKGTAVPSSRLQRANGSEDAAAQVARLLAARLTPREWQVLALLVEGATSSRIARTLSISPNTLRSHSQRILSKLQVHSRLEAVAFAIRHNLTAETSWGASDRGSRVLSST